MKLHGFYVGLIRAVFVAHKVIIEVLIVLGKREERRKEEGKKEKGERREERREERSGKSTAHSDGEDRAWRLVVLLIN
ncbi:MAG: hypothetical protein ACI9Z7_000448 [Alteromonas macleodii]|jgi:hypothetical protein